MSLTDKNLYAYCDNNPVVRSDSEGKIWVYAAIGGAIAGGAISAVSHLVVNGGVSDGFVKDVFWGALGGAIGGVAGVVGSINTVARVSLSVLAGVTAGMTASGTLEENLFIGVTTAVSTFAGTLFNTGGLSKTATVIANVATTTVTGIPAEIINTPTRVAINNRSTTETSSTNTATGGVKSSSPTKPRNYVSILDYVY